MKLDCQNWVHIQSPTGRSIMDARENYVPFFFPWKCISSLAKLFTTLKVKITFLSFFFFFCTADWSSLKLRDANPISGQTCSLMRRQNEGETVRNLFWVLWPAIGCVWTHWVLHLRAYLAALQNNSPECSLGVDWHYTWHHCANGLTSMSRDSWTTYSTLRPRSGSPHRFEPTNLFAALRLSGSSEWSRLCTDVSFRVQELRFRGRSRRGMLPTNRDLG